MEYRNSKEKEVIVDIESGETNLGADTKNDPNSGNKWGKKSLNKLVSRVLGLNGPSNIESDVISGGSIACSHEMTELTVDNNPGGHLLPLIDKDHEKERRKTGKAKKPPRPPKGPSLDAADMRLVKEISKTAMKKRERIERMKALKKMKAARMSSPSSSSSSSSGGTISAMIITVLFFLVIIFQGFGSSSSSKLIIAGAPQPAPETTGLTPLQFYETVLSDDGAAPSFVPPKSKEQLSVSEFSSLG
ncbi:hypothetical protein BUALT_Bualt02G0244200 [Buddleja alternifolia]|uniref:Transmembrane protein n=1 Tax=Buddleja alternifolia TaxID=168488 RepID=A0AAV6Y4D7_9LAMI|nr:hypothetical protein BUALT_Bualt02G0244200 [Buddleja alternifolia]